MRKNKKTVVIIIAVLLVVGGLFFWNAVSAGPHDEFALCLAEKEVVFFGAFWCSACNEQKQLFGKSAKKLPYTECSPSNRQGQFPVCEEAGIQAYPTWEFSDGSRETGVLSFSELSERTGCVSPK